MKNKLYSLMTTTGVLVSGLVAVASNAFAVDAHMSVLNVAGLATTTLGDFGDQKN